MLVRPTEAAANFTQHDKETSPSGLTLDRISLVTDIDRHTLQKMHSYHSLHVLGLVN